MHILTVCHGNVCRSAMAEYLLRDEFARHGMRAVHPHAPHADAAAPGTIAISSAGLLHLPPRAIDPTCQRLLASRGIDASDHVSTVYVPAMAMEADLTLCFTRDQLEGMLHDAPKALSRTFLIDDFANLCAASMRDGGPEGLTPAQRLASLLEEAPLMRPLLPPAHDIADPYRRAEADYQAAFEAIAQDVGTIVDALAPIRTSATLPETNPADA